MDSDNSHPSVHWMEQPESLHTYPAPTGPVGNGVGTTLPPSHPAVDHKVEKKSGKFTLSKFFKPWTWMKKKKPSEKFQKTAVELERKISVRSTRDDLIKKGVLKEGFEINPDIPVHSSTAYQPHVLEAVTEEEKSDSGDYNHRPPTPTSNPNYPYNQPLPGSPRHRYTTNGTAVRPPEIPDNRGGDGGPPPSRGVRFNDASPSPSQGNSPAVQGDCMPAVSVYPAYPFSGRPPSDSYSREANPQQIRVMLPLEDKSKPVIQHLKQQLSFQQNVGTGAQQGSPAPAPRGSPRLSSSSSYAPNPEVQEYPISEPDLTKKPARSAMKTGRSTQYQAPGLQQQLQQKLQQRNSMGLSSGNTQPTDTPLGPVGQGDSLPRAGPKVAPKPKSVLFTNTSSVRGDSNRESAVQPTGVEPDYDIPQSHYYDDSSDDEEIHYTDKESILASKVQRSDSLARLLAQRPTPEEMLERNLIREQSDEERLHNRETISVALNRRLSLRPTPDELQQRNILHDVSEYNERIREKEEKKKTLDRKLSFRPTIEELKERKIIRFNDYVEVTGVDDYDRKADKPWTRLTAKDKAAIRKELNDFKASEMEVHDESKQFTRFHRP